MGHQNSNLNAGDTLSNYAENPLMVLCSSAGSMGLMIYILILGLVYPTPGGCTSLDNGDLPNQSGLDLGWWFEVYGAIGITFVLLRALVAMLGSKLHDLGAKKEDRGLINSLKSLVVCPIGCTLMVFFVWGNVWLFYFTPETTFSNGGSSDSTNTSVPSGSNVVNGGGGSGVIDGTNLATNCQWLSLNGYWIFFVSWILAAVGCCCVTVVVYRARP